MKLHVGSMALSVSVNCVYKLLNGFAEYSLDETELLPGLLEHFFPVKEVLYLLHNP